MLNPLDHPICFSQPLRLPDDPSTPNWIEHVPFAMFLIAVLRPRVIVELGTHAGISYCAFCQAVKELGTNTRCYAIDTWLGDDQAGLYSPDVLDDLRGHHDPLYGGFSRLVRSTFDEAVGEFPDGSIDLLHIDGCHTYDAVKHDFESWLPKLSDHAVVLLHDINVRERQFGVWRLWEELAAQYRHFSFLHGHGLGLLVVDRWPSDMVRQLVETPEDEVPRLRAFFYRLGLNLTVQYERNHILASLTSELGTKEQHIRNLAEREAATATELALKEQHVRNLTERDVAIAAELARAEQQVRQLTDDSANHARRDEELLAQRDAAQRHRKELEAQLDYRTRAVEALSRQVEDKERHIQNLAALISDRDRLARELDALTIERERLSRRLHEIESRVSWQLLQKAWQAQMRVAAPHTRQGRAWLAATAQVRKVLPKGLVRRTHASLAPTSPHTRLPALPAILDEPGAATSRADEYAAWIARSEPSPDELQEQRVTARRFTYRPLISVVTPVYNPPVQILRETIASIAEQTYENWEFCLVDGGSTLPEIGEILERAAAHDPRIRVEALGRNLGIAGNSNAAVALARGEFIALLDHDDLLAPNTLYEVVAALNRHPEADLLYFDEDKLSEDGARRSEPFFKPDWSPEMLLSANYLMHSVIRRSLFEEVGGFNPDTDGAQDWDLLLRCTERTDAIVHIPKVLYHWRQVVGSTAAVFRAKPYVFDNQLRSVAEHLRRQGIAGAEAHFPSPGFLQVVWPPRGAKVSIIIPTKEKVELLRPCLTSLLRLTRYAHYEVLLVDNGSQLPGTLGYYAELASEPRVRIIDYPPAFNYSAANNLGARQATGEILLFLNNDIEILDPDWLEELVRWADRPDIGAVGAKLLYPDGRIQHAGVVIGMEGHASHIFWGVREKHSGPFGSSDWYRNYLAVTGACMMMRRALFEEVGGFDEGYQLAFSDIEICLRIARAGYRNIYTPFARLRHHEGASRGQHIPVNDLLLGYDQMHTLVEAGDPYYNPNLSYAGRIPALTKPGEEARGERLRRLCGVRDPQATSTAQLVGPTV